MHRPRPPQWSALDAARAGTARPMLLGLPAELRCSRPPPLAAESDERSTGTCRARWATPCTDLPFSVVVVAGSSGCGLTDDFQARRATSQRRGDLFEQVCGSIVVSISACHAEGPGSIPGRGAACTDRARHNGQLVMQPGLGQCASHASGFARRAPLFSVAAAGRNIGRQGTRHVQSGMGHAMHRFGVLGCRGRRGLGLRFH